MRRWLGSAILVFALVSIAVADPEPTQCPSGLSLPLTGPIVVRSPLSSGWLKAGVPLAPTFVVIPGAIVPSPLTTRPVVVAPGGYFCVQFQSGNWTVAWCEPLRTNVVILGRPYIRYVREPRYFVRPLFPFVRPPLLTYPLIVDPSVTLGLPQIWHSPLLQPGVLVFRLKHRSAEEVAKLLNEARVLPDGQFAGMGNLLIVSAPSLATSGVQQSRLHDLIRALDQPTQSAPPTSSPAVSATGWRVEVYRAHPTTCASQAQLPEDRAPVLLLSGYPCVHKLGEGVWQPATQPRLFVKGEKVDLTLHAEPTASGWQLVLTGRWQDQPVHLDGHIPSLSQPVLLLPPTAEGKEAVVLLLLPETNR